MGCFTRNDLVRSLSSEGDGAVGERDESVTVTLEELVHVLDPVETKGVEEGRQGLENHEYTNGGSQEDGPDGEGNDGTHGETVLGETQVPEDGGQLGVSKRQSPETEVGGSVGNSSEDELDGLNDLMDENFTEVEGTVSVTMSTGSGGRGGFLFILVEDSIRVLVLVAEDEGLDEQHGGNANEGDDQKGGLEGSLTRVDGHFGVLTGAEEHVDHHGKEERGRVGVGQDVTHLVRVEGVVPLDEDESRKVTEEREEKGDLRDALEEQVELVVPVNRVQNLHHETQGHVSDSNDDGHLHLNRIVVDELVLSSLPHPINSEFVSTLSQADRGTVDSLIVRSVGNKLALASVFGAASPSGGENLHGDGEEFIVKETAVNGKQGHAEDDVATSEGQLNQFVQLLVRPLLLLVDHEESKCSKTNSVSNVTEHDTEHEGEGNDSKDSGVDLLVARDTIGINDGLETGGKLVGGKVGGRHLVSVQGRQERRHLSSRAVLSAAKRNVDLFERTSGDPSFSDETLATDIEIEQVHRVVDGLLLAHLHEPSVELSSNGGQ